jgi:hypothetical protein
MKSKIKAVALLRTHMIIGNIGPAQTDGTVVIRELNARKFEFSINKKFTTLLRPSDVVEILCVPTSDQGASDETLVVAKKVGRKLRLIFTLSNFWTEQFDQLGPRFS